MSNATDEFNTRPIEQYYLPNEIGTSGQEINAISKEYLCEPHKTSSAKKRKTSRVTKMLLGTIMGTLTLTSVTGTAVDKSTSEPTEIVEETTNNTMEDWSELAISVSDND